MARVEAKRGFVVETPFGYYNGVYMDPEREFSIYDRYKDYKFISCTGEINDADIFYSEYMANECAEGVGGKVVPAIRMIAIDTAREDEKPASLGLVINNMLMDEQDRLIRKTIKEGKNIRYADDKDPMYDDSGYQPDPDFEEE